MRTPILVIAFLLLQGCDTTEKQNQFAAEASLPPKGFTATTETGEILAEDSDDWRTSPVYFGKIRVDPLYPNPSSVEFVTLPVSILQFDSVAGGFTLRAYDASGLRLILLDSIREIGGPGAYILRFNPAVLGRTGLVRVFLFDSANEIVSYGDVSVQPV